MYIFIIYFFPLFDNFKYTNHRLLWWNFFSKYFVNITMLTIKKIEKNWKLQYFIMTYNNNTISLLVNIFTTVNNFPNIVFLYKKYLNIFHNFYSRVVRNYVKKLWQHFLWSKEILRCRVERLALGHTRWLGHGWAVTMAQNLEHALYRVPRSTCSISMMFF